MTTKQKERLLDWVSIVAVAFVVCGMCSTIAMIIEEAIRP